MDVYWVVFAVAAATAAALEYTNRMGGGGAGSTKGPATNKEFTLFRNNYLIVYSLMMGEWMAGRRRRGHWAGNAPHTVSQPPATSRPPRHLAIPPLPTAAGDWLQGPHVYRLYEYYGFDMGQIGKLFIAGFGSSMVFGTVVGALADKQCVVSLAALLDACAWTFGGIRHEVRHRRGRDGTSSAFPFFLAALG